MDFSFGPTLYDYGNGIDPNLGIKFRPLFADASVDGISCCHRTERKPIIRSLKSFDGCVLL